MREKKITWGKPPSDNISLDDCEWYHIMEIPGVDGLTDGVFDCREDIDNILKLLKFDKKNSHGNINFVLLKNIGEPAIDVKVVNELLTEAFSYYKE